MFRKIRYGSAIEEKVVDDFPVAFGVVHFKVVDTQILPRNEIGKIATGMRGFRFGIKSDRLPEPSVYSENPLRIVSYKVRRKS